MTLLNPMANRQRTSIAERLARAENWLALYDDIKAENPDSTRGDILRLVATVTGDKYDTICAWLRSHGKYPPPMPSDDKRSGKVMPEYHKQLMTSRVQNPLEGIGTADVTTEDERDVRLTPKYAKAEQIFNEIARVFR